MDLLTQCYNARNPEKRVQETEQALLRSEQRKLVEETAFHDEGIGPHPSPGETDALITSELLDIQRGDVLRDPKLRGYVHPSLRR